MLETLHLIALILHVLGAAIIIGGVFAGLLILVREKIGRDNLEYVNYLWKFLTPTIGIQILTGIFLAASEWSDFRRNPLLWAKIILLVVDGFLGGRVLGRIVEDNLRKGTREVSIKGARRLIWISFLIFVLIATFGVMLAEGNHK